VPTHGERANVKNAASGDAAYNAARIAPVGRVPSRGGSPEGAKEGDELPKGWRWSPLEELCSVVRGSSPRPAGDPRYFGGDVPWITVGPITADNTPYLRAVPNTVTAAEKERSRFVEPGTLLLTNSGATLGVPKITLIGGCINDGVAALLNVPEPLKLYLLYFLQTQTERLRNVNQGAAQPNLNTSIIKSISVPIAPPNEQRRIVAEIEKQFTRLEAGVAALRRVQANLKRYRAAVLKAACEGVLESVEVSASRLKDFRLADICESITDGDHQPPPKRPQGSPLLTISNISSGRLDFSDTLFVPEEYYRQIKPNRIPRPNEVLYSVVGATIGIPVLVNTDRIFCFSRHIALLKPSPKVLPKFLWLLMASPQTLREAWKRTTGSAQPTLVLRPLRDLPVKLPPLAEQTRIVAEVERRLSVVEELEAVVSANLQRTTRLRQSILQKAFFGKLS
jgi:type I restriction enzyme S subunit